MRHQHKRNDNGKGYTCVKTLDKGQVERKIIARAKNDTHEFSLHATKGYRAKRI